jgi:hypothetical protein
MRLHRTTAGRDAAALIAADIRIPAEKRGRLVLSARRAAGMPGVETPKMSFPSDLPALSIPITHFVYRSE